MQPLMSVTGIVHPHNAWTSGTQTGHFRGPGWAEEFSAIRENSRAIILQRSATPTSLAPGVRNFITQQTPHWPDLYVETEFSGSFAPKYELAEMNPARKIAGVA